MSKRPNIADAMRDVAGSTRARPVAALVEKIEPAAKPAPTADTASGKSNQPSRAGTKAITGHFPPAVRYQLKLLAAEQGRTMEDLLAEGLNMLFAAYNKPEIAPTINAGTASKN
jgi:hypothetical protein